MKPYNKNQKVICVRGYTYYGPPHLQVDKEYTVSKCDASFVYIEEIYSGRYGFYYDSFKPKDIDCE